MQHSIDLEVKVTITARDDERFDITCSAHPEYNRMEVAREDLRVEAANMIAEVGDRVANQHFPMHP